MSEYCNMQSYRPGTAFQRSTIAARGPICLKSNPLETYYAIEVGIYTTCCIERQFARVGATDHEEGGVHETLAM